MCAPLTSTTSTLSPGSGREASQSITPSSRLMIAVSGTGGGAAIAARSRTSSASHSSAAASARGASGAPPANGSGLTRVMTRAT